jgi:hypothetical protein
MVQVILYDKLHARSSKRISCRKDQCHDGRQAGQAENCGKSNGTAQDDRGQKIKGLLIDQQPLDFVVRPA